jgi:hypothetical protein
MDLDRQFCSTDKIICGLENVKSKKELIEILSYIKGYVNRLETLSQEFDEQLLEDIPLLTKDTLVREKKLYLQKICCDKKDIL